MHSIYLFQQDTKRVSSAALTAMLNIFCSYKSLHIVTTISQKLQKLSKTSQYSKAPKHHLYMAVSPSGQPANQVAPLPSEAPGNCWQSSVSLVTERRGCQDSVSPAVVLLFLLLIPEGPLS